MALISLHMGDYLFINRLPGFRELPIARLELLGYSQSRRNISTNEITGCRTRWVVATISLSVTQKRLFTCTFILLSKKYVCGGDTSTWSYVLHLWSLLLTNILRMVPWYPNMQEQVPTMKFDVCLSMHCTCIEKKNQLDAT